MRFWRNIGRNHISGHPQTAEEGTHHTALPDEEIMRIKREIPLLAVRNERLFMALLAFTGMRPEEIMGLKWEDVHLERQYAEVKRAVIYPRKHAPIIKSTKTKNRREQFFCRKCLWKSCDLA